jgi:hypothetical protein
MRASRTASSVRQHATTISQSNKSGDIGCGLRPSSCKLVHAVLMTDIGDYPGGRAARFAAMAVPMAPQADSRFAPAPVSRTGRFVIG